MPGIDRFGSGHDECDLHKVCAHSSGRAREVDDELGAGEELWHDHVMPVAEVCRGHRDREPPRNDTGVRQ